MCYIALNHLLWMQKDKVEWMKRKKERKRTTTTTTKLSERLWREWASYADKNGKVKYFESSVCLLIWCALNMEMSRKHSYAVNLLINLLAIINYAHNYWLRPAYSFNVIPNPFEEIIKIKKLVSRNPLNKCNNVYFIRQRRQWHRLRNNRFYKKRKQFNTIIVCGPYHLNGLSG